MGILRFFTGHSGINTELQSVIDTTAFLQPEQPGFLGFLHFLKPFEVSGCDTKQFKCTAIIPELPSMGICELPVMGLCRVPGIFSSL